MLLVKFSESFVSFIKSGPTKREEKEGGIETVILLQTTCVAYVFLKKGGGGIETVRLL
jgi:hypothetical protein